MAIDFNSAASQYLVVSDSADFTVAASGSCSMSAWARTESLGANRNIYRHDANAGGRHIIGMRMNSADAWEILFGDTGSTFDQIAFGTVSINTWTHIAWTTDTANNKYLCYVDGAQVSNPAKNVVDAVDPSDLYIGSAKVTSELWNGQICELALWNGTELTPSEITMLYAGGSPIHRMPLLLQPAYLKAYWPMNDAANGISPTTVYDWSGGGHDATPGNSPIGIGTATGNLAGPLHLISPKLGNRRRRLLFSGAA